MTRLSSWKDRARELLSPEPSPSHRSRSPLPRLFSSREQNTSSQNISRLLRTESLHRQESEDSITPFLSNVPVPKKEKTLPAAVDEHGILDAPSPDHHHVSALRTENNLNIFVEDETVEESLWDIAYAKLQAKNPKLIENYEKVIRTKYPAFSTETGGLLSIDTNNRQDTLAAIIQQELEKSETSEWTLQLGGQKVLVKEQVDRAIKAANALRSFVATAANAEPHAALAWAGVSLLLPFLLNPSTQSQAVKDGSEAIPALVQRYQIYERMYLNHNRSFKADRNTSKQGQSHEEVRKLIETLRGAFIKLYTIVLEFQARAVCQFSSTAAYRYARDVVKADDWSTMITSMKQVDEKCVSMIHTLENEWIDRRMEAQWIEIRQLNEDWHRQHKDLDDIRKTIITIRDEEEKTHCHQILSSDYESQKNRNKKRAPNTCNWLLEHPKFKNWSSKESVGLLWLTTDPGCGKSVISRALIDENLIAESASVTICYFFFKDGFVDQKDATKGLCAILHQLFKQRPFLIRHALPAFRVNGTTLSSLFHDLWAIFMAAVADPEAGEIICIFDGLDECEQESREELIEKFEGYYLQPNNTFDKNLRILSTSRPYSEIKRAFRTFTSTHSDGHLAGEAESEEISKEINHAIKHRVLEVARRIELKEEAREHLEGRLLAMENRTYLWLHLIFDVIESSFDPSTVKKLDKILADIPKTVVDAYNTILDRSPNYALTLKLLQIVVAAFRPLNLQEVNIALFVEKGMTGYEDLDFDEEETDTKIEEKIRRLCGLFVTVVDSKVYLIHQTAREYLLQTDQSKRGYWNHSILLKDAHIVLAQACFFYILFDVFEQDLCYDRARLVKEDFYLQMSSEMPIFMEGSYADEIAALLKSKKSASEDTESENSLYLTEPELLLQDKYKDLMNAFIQRHPFISYSATSGPKHHKRSGEVDDLHVYANILFSPGSRRYWNWMNIYGFKDTGYTTDLEGWEVLLTKSPQIFMASSWGLQRMVQDIVDKSVDVNVTVGYWGAALHFASSHGHIDIINILVNAGADVNSITTDGNTPIHCAIYDAKVKALKTLVSFGADVNVENIGGFSPLALAIEREQLEMAKYLLENGANPSPTLRIQPLCMAATYSNVEMVKILLDHKADVNIVTVQLENRLAKQTALSAAVTANNFEIVKLLLEAGANQDIPLEFSPVSLAASMESWDILKLLLSYRPDLSLSSHSSQLLLYAAAKQEDEDLAKQVLDLGLPTDYGIVGEPSPLLYLSVESRNINIAKSLIAHGAELNPSLTENMTPLYFSVAAGDLEFTKILLENGADIEIRVEGGYTPLRLAVEGYDIDMIKLLISKGANVNSVDDLGNTPLIHLASLSWNLETENPPLVNSNKPNRFSSRLDNESNILGTARFLLQNGADIEAKNRNGHNPLHRACLEGENQMVTMLLEKGAKIEAACNDDERALHHACRYFGSKERIEILLRYGAEINSKCRSGRTPLCYAINKSDEMAVDTLLDHGASLDVTSNKGEVPLFFAIQNSDVKLCKKLLEYGASPNSLGPKGDPVIFWPTETGKVRLVELLLDKGANVHSRDTQGTQGNSLIAYGVRYNHFEVVELLLQRGAKVDDRDYSGNPLLRHPVMTMNIKLLKLLFKHGADPNIPWAKGQRCLSAATEKGSAKLIRVLLRHKADPNLVDYNQKTPLIYAALKNIPDFVEILLKAKSNPEIKDKLGRTALMWAVIKGHVQVARLLLEHGAKVNDTDNHCSLLHQAISKGSQEMVLLLLLAGADVNALDKDGDSPLLWAVEGGNVALAELLMEHGADINADTGLDGSPLQLARLYSNSTLVDLFLRRGAKEGRAPSEEVIKDVRKKLEKEADLDTLPFVEDKP